MGVYRVVWSVDAAPFSLIVDSDNQNIISCSLGANKPIDMTQAEANIFAGHLRKVFGFLGDGDPFGLHEIRWSVGPEEFKLHKQLYDPTVWLLSAKNRAPQVLTSAEAIALGKKLEKEFGESGRRARHKLRRSLSH